MLLCHDPDTCRQLSAALSSTPAPPLGELPLLPRTPPTANAPESALATQLAFLATAKNAWDTAVGAVLGSPAAMQAMHALLHLTEDEEMCQVRSFVCHCEECMRAQLSALCCACSYYLGIPGIPRDLLSCVLSCVDEQISFVALQSVLEIVSEGLAGTLTAVRSIHGRYACRCLAGCFWSPLLHKSGCNMPFLTQ